MSSKAVMKRKRNPSMEHKCESCEGAWVVDGDHLLTRYTNAFPHAMTLKTILRFKELLRQININQLQFQELLKEQNRGKNEENNNEGSKRAIRSTRLKIYKDDFDYPRYSLRKKGCDFYSLVCNDISDGQEHNNISVINDCDIPPIAPLGFKYMNHMQVPDSIKVPSRDDGCMCKTRCTTTCACVMLNGSEPYVSQNGGRLKEPRDVVFECGPKCGCGPDCGNRVSQKGIMYKLQVFCTPNKGWGVRTLESIPAGAPVCEYVGVLRRSDEVENDIDNRYILDIDCKQTINGIGGRKRRIGHVVLPMSSTVDDKITEKEPEFCIDGSCYGNVGRFINHSCEPNLFIQCVLSDHTEIKLARVMLFTSKEITPRQELTYDYGYQLDSVMGPDGSIKKMLCHCDAPLCRKRLY